MTKSYAQLKSAIAKLEKEAAALREAETTKVIAQIRESIATFGLTVEHLFGRGAKALKAAASRGPTGKAVRKGAGVPKYRHPKTGKTWTGFGKAPGWIATVRNRDKFLIDQSGVATAPSVEEAAAPVAVVAKKATRTSRTGGAPGRKPIRVKKAVVAGAAALETKAAKAVAKKAVPKKRAPSQKPVPVKKAASAAKARRSRGSKNATVAELTSATPETAASAS